LTVKPTSDISNENVIALQRHNKLMRVAKLAFQLVPLLGCIFSGCKPHVAPSVGNAFREGAEFNIEGKRGVITLVDMGTISFPSGKAVPKDTMTLSEDAELDREVPKSPAKVVAAVAKHASGDERVAFLRVRFREETPTKHELAIRRISADWHESYKEAYPVDSGFGGFIDQKVQAEVNKAIEDAATGVSKKLHDQLQKTQRNTWSWANLEIVQGIYLLVVSSGYGDGAFKTYYGLNDRGEIIELVTDFRVF
jgi:hypothetical protein